MRNHSMFGLVALAALAGCTPGTSEDPGTVTINHTNTVTNVNTNVNTTTITTTTTKPAPATPCDEKQSGLICTYVGVPHLAQFSPEALPRTESALYLPIDITVSPNDGLVYIIDFNNHRIRVVNADDTVTTIAGTGFLGDGIFNDATGLWEDGPALSFAFNHPANVAFDPIDEHYMYIGAWHNSRVERYNTITEEVEYYGGTGGRSYGTGDDGDPDGDGVHTFYASTAIFNLTAGITFDDNGDLYVADQANLLIRKINRNGEISNVVGTQAQNGYFGDGGDATLAKLSNNTGQLAPPQGRVVYHDDALYIADTGSSVIRKVDLSVTPNIITTVVGTFEADPNGLDTDGDGDGDLFYGVGGYAGDGGQADQAKLNFPQDLAFGPDGTMYIADTLNHCVRAVDANNTISTFAGQCGVATGPADDLGDNGSPTVATLNNPSGIDVDAAGNVFIADQYNHVIRVVWK